MEAKSLCMNCGVVKKRTIYFDNLGQYINCECGSSSDTDVRIGVLNKDLEEMYIENFILWKTHKNRQENPLLYVDLDDYMKEASTEEK